MNRLTLGLLVSFCMAHLCFAATDGASPKTFGFMDSKKDEVLTSLKDPSNHSLMSTLSQDTKIPFVPKAYKTQDDVVNDLVHDKLAVAYVSSYDYYRAAQRNLNLIPVAYVKEGEDEKGNPVYYGAIITRKDSGITSIDQLSDKRVAFTHKDSAAGYLYPGYFYKSALSTSWQHPIFAGENNISLLHARKVDAIALWYDLATRERLDAALGKENYRVLAKYRVPSYRFVVNRRLMTPDEIKNLQDKLINYSNNHGKTFHQGFVAPPTDKAQIEERGVYRKITCPECFKLA